MIKVPIMLTLFDKIERGELEYGAEMTYLDTTIYAGDDGIVASLKDSTKIALSKLVMLMITTSDNSASLWCQALAGTGTEINRWLAENGFEQTRVNSRTPDRREGYQAYGWGQTTPREMAGLLELIRRGQAVSADASEEMYRILTRIYWNSEALSEIPPYVQAASKQGAVNQSRSEVVLVNAPSGDYVFCVITKIKRIRVGSMIMKDLFCCGRCQSCSGSISNPNRPGNLARISTNGRNRMPAICGR